MTYTIDPNLMNIHTAKQFENFMRKVWAMEQEITSNGLILYASPLYDAYCDAIKVIRWLRIPRTGSTKINNDWWDIYRFPDDSGIAIARNGSACTLIHTRFSQRTHFVTTTTDTTDA